MSILLDDFPFRPGETKTAGTHQVDNANGATMAAFSILSAAAPRYGVSTDSAFHHHLGGIDLLAAPQTRSFSTCFPFCFTHKKGLQTLGGKTRQKKRNGVHRHTKVKRTGYLTAVYVCRRCCFAISTDFCKRRINVMDNCWKNPSI